MITLEFISPLEVWRRYIKNSVKFKKTTSIPISKRIEIILDLYFGQLTIHTFQKFQRESIEINCIECNINKKSAACDIHLGVMLGIIEAWFCTSYKHEIEIERDICRISMYKITK